MSDDFISLYDSLGVTNRPRSSGDSDLVKKERVRFVKNNNDAPELSEEREPPPQNTKKISPIYDGDSVVGVTIECTCGETTIVYFEYESDAS